MSFLFSRQLNSTTKIGSFNFRMNPKNKCSIGYGWYIFFPPRNSFDLPTTGRSNNQNNIFRVTNLISLSLHNNYAIKKKGDSSSIALFCTYKKKERQINKAQIQFHMHTVCPSPIDIQQLNIRFWGAALSIQASKPGNNIYT